MVPILLCLLILFFPQTTFAQATPDNTLSVSPSIIRLDLQKDQPETTISYKNTTKQTIQLSFTAADFTELEYGYKPSFLDEKNAENYKYALSSWITFDKQALVLDPQSMETIKVFINNDKLTPGGHYAAIVAHIASQNEEGNVAIQGSISSLLFVRTNTGRENENGKIEKFAPMRDWLIFPKNFLLRFHNTGDTDVIPYGLVTIQDMFGRPIASGIYNEGSLISLPESIRRFDIPIKQSTPFLLPGIYQATFKGHFGKTNKQIQTHVTFFSEGSVPLLQLSILLVVITGLAIWKKKRNR